MSVIPLVVACAMTNPQVEAIEYEMLEVVSPRPATGFSNCVDINDSNVAVAMSGGYRLGVSGGVGSSQSWIWQNGESKRIQGVQDFVIVCQIENDNTIGLLIPRFDAGVQRWHAAFIRPGQAYASPLTVYFMDWMRPYDHNDGVSGAALTASSGFTVVPKETEIVDVPTKGLPGPGRAPAKPRGSVEVTKYDTQYVYLETLFGGIDRKGAWAFEPLRDTQVVLTSARGAMVTYKIDLLTALGGGRFTRDKWRTINGNPEINYPWPREGGEEFRVYRINNSGWATYAERGPKPTNIPHAFLLTLAGEIPVGLPGGSICDPMGLNENGDVTGSSESKTAGRFHGFVYTKGVNYDLNDVTFDRHGWVLSSAQAINEGRWIAATAIKGKQYIAFVLKPLVLGSIRRAAKIALGHVYDGIVGARPKP